MLSDQKLDLVRAMTIGQLLDLLNTSGNTADDNWSKIKTILALILWDAEEFFDNRAASDAEDGVRIAAVRIAAHALAEDGLNKDTAKCTANDMAFLAHDMLRQSGAGEWDFATLVALKKIRRSDRELARKFPPEGSTPAPLPHEKCWKDEELPF